MKPRIVVLHGHHTAAEPWPVSNLLAGRFDFTFAVTDHRPGDEGKPAAVVRSRRGLLPRGRAFDLATLVPGDGYRGLADALRGADIVHSVEVGPWYSGQAAHLRRALDFRLVVTVWETIPLLDAYRRRRARANRAATLANTDLFLPTSERSAMALRLEGVEEERIQVCLPAVDTDTFAATRRRPVDSTSPLIVSPGRLVWEKGHQDILRATALLHRGIVTRPDGKPVAPRVLIVGAGPEEARLRLHAAELGIGDAVEFRRSVPNAEMADLFAGAACIVLASLPVWHWEEQFGMVIAEAFAGGTPVVTTRSGAIPEVVGDSALLVDAGDFPALARTLAEGPLSDPPRVPEVDPALVERYSMEAYAERLAAAYERVLAQRR